MFARLFGGGKQTPAAPSGGAGGGASGQVINAMQVRHLAPRCGLAGGLVPWIGSLPGA